MRPVGRLLTVFTLPAKFWCLDLLKNFPILALGQHRHLLISLVQREFRDKHLGNVFGILWLFVHPLILVSVYILVFSFILKVRVADSSADGAADYCLYLLSGLLPWLVTSDTLAKGSGLMMQNVNLVKQVIFPVNILPIKNGISGMVLFCIYLVFLLMYAAYMNKLFSPILLLLPLLMALHGALLIGLSFVFSTIGVFFRDVRELVTVYAFVSPYLSPIFFLPEKAPEMIRPLFFLNPFSYFVWCYQDIFYFQRIEHPLAWGVVGGMSILLLVLGGKFFELLRPSFSDVL